MAESGLWWFCGKGGGRLALAAGQACLVVVLWHGPFRMCDGILMEQFHFEIDFNNLNR